MLSLYLSVSDVSEKMKYFNLKKIQVLARIEPQPRIQVIKQLFILDLYRILFFEREKCSKSLFPKCGNTGGPGVRQYII
jgi:hypothetical protein